MARLTTLISGDRITTPYSPQSSQPLTFHNGEGRRIESLAGPRLRKRKYQAEEDYAANYQLLDAMDWLFDQGIVFDILPEDQTVRKLSHPIQKFGRWMFNLSTKRP